MEKNSKLKGINFYEPKCADKDIHNVYLSALDSAVERKLKLQRLRKTEVESNNEPNNLTMNTTGILNLSALNNTTMIQDQSIISHHPLNVSVVNVAPLAVSYGLNFMSKLPACEEMNNDFKRGAKDGTIEQRLY